MIVVQLFVQVLERRSHRHIPSALYQCYSVVVIFLLMSRTQMLVISSEIEENLLLKAGGGRQLFVVV